MGVFSKYHVILSGDVIAERDREEVLEGLAALFNSKRQVMAQLLQGKEISLKKEYSKKQAAIICQKIRKIGAQCKIEEIIEAKLEIVEDSIPDRGTSYEVIDDQDNSIDPYGIGKEDTRDRNLPKKDRHQEDSTEASPEISREKKVQNLIMGFC